MTCPICGLRKARRECPALGRTICSVCCATKRQVEIACPEHCGYLATGREHPAAIVRRRQEQDAERLLPSIRHLTERQYQLFFVFQTAIARHRPAGPARVLDLDVADAAAAVAATLETASRGVIYEHAPNSGPAIALAADLRETLSEVREQGARVSDHEAATVLRAIETGARTVGTPGSAGGQKREYLDTLCRLLQIPGQAAGERGAGMTGPGGLILP